MVTSTIAILTIGLGLFAEGLKSINNTNSVMISRPLPNYGQFVVEGDVVGRISQNLNGFLSHSQKPLFVITPRKSKPVGKKSSRTSNYAMLPDNLNSQRVKRKKENDN